MALHITVTSADVHNVGHIDNSNNVPTDSQWETSWNGTAYEIKNNGSNGTKVLKAIIPTAFKTKLCKRS